MNVEVIMPADDTSGFYEGELQKMGQVVNEINHMLEQKDLDASIHTNAKFHSLHITINECTNFGLIKLLANPDETGVRNYHNRLQAYCKLITPYPGKTIVYHFIPPFSFSKLNIPPYKNGTINCVATVYLSNFAYNRDSKTLSYTLSLYLAAIQAV